MVKQDLKYLEDKYGIVSIRDSFAGYEELSRQDPKTYRPLSENARIFPMYFAPVVYMKDAQLVCEPMRYQAWPEDLEKDPKHLTLYNARLDNLRSKIWKTMVRRHHGFIVANAFFEWVKVNDLIRAKKVSIRDVEMEFMRQTQARRAKLAAEGKPYKPTPTEKQPAMDRKIIIRFRPTLRPDMLIPVIFAERQLVDGKMFKSFAIVTDEPPPEVLTAGHDRCPINLDYELIKQYVTPPFTDANALEKLLSARPQELYAHDLPGVS
jgi:putative SOS response-associated peptidase YedK